MTDPETRALRQLARHCGIQTSYMDVMKRRQEASPDSLIAVLQAWGVRIDKPAEASERLREIRSAKGNRAVEPVAVAWNGAAASVELRIPAAHASKNVECRLFFEDGGERRWNCRLKNASGKASRESGAGFVSKSLGLPSKLPFGYHRLEIELPNETAKTLVVSAPEKIYSGRSGAKEWGVFVPTYALHSERSLGAGDLGDLGDLGGWVAGLGGKVVATLPLLPAFLDKPFDPSPYSPVTRLFWNEFYLDLGQVPELSHSAEARALIQSPSFQRKLKALRREPLVDYRGQSVLKGKVLQLLANFFFSRDSARRREFNRFLKQNPRWEDYACFRAACDRQQKPWLDWPEQMREGVLCEGDYDENARQYHLYAQWLAREQMEAMAARNRNLGLKVYLDLPLGVHDAGYDAWRERDSFAASASGGAPPDAVFTKGQDWGFAPLHPQRIRQQEYRYLREYLHHHLKLAGMLRIDHVMCLHRLYWVPKGLDASHGAYVDYPAEELYAILAIESHRHQSVIVGENLGTVPPEVNRSMDRHHMRQMYVGIYEQKPDPRRALRPPPRKCVASLNTHDMPPFNAYWQGLDLEDRREIGLMNERGLKKEQKLRREMNKALVAFLKRRKFLQTDRPDVRQVLAAYLEFLAASDAEMLLVNLEDLWLETHSQNLPGTGHERPNWRRKTRHPLESIHEMPEAVELLKRVNQFRTKVK